MFRRRPLYAAFAALLAVPVLVSGWRGAAPADDGAAPSTGRARVAVQAAGGSAASAAVPPDAAAPSAGRYPAVDVVRPAIRVVGGDAAVDGRRIGATSGVRYVTEVRRGRILVNGPAGSRELIAAAVDPRSFRRFVPQVTADAIGVWQRLDDGEAVLLHAAASDLRLPLGTHVSFGRDRQVTLRVGALASNGTPPVGDVVVTRTTGRLLGLEAVEPTFLVSLESGTDADAVARRLADSVRGEVEVIPDPREVHAVTAPQRQAAATVWDVLALCESSGNWHIDTGNGFYGGLQFLPESWWLVGGRGMPHEASREEQIHRAQLLLAIQGWEAWPVCSVKLGLRPPPPGWQHP